MENERHSLLVAILETAVDAIIVIDEHGVIQSVNPATEQLFGYSKNEVVGSNIKQLMPSPYREEHDDYLQHYHDTRERRIIGIGREVVGQRKDGSTFPIYLSVSEFAVDGRKFFTGIVHDITKLKAAERQLTEMNTMLEEKVRERTRELREAQAELVRKEKLATLGQISAGIAHEIRNPLNAVKTSAYFLLHAQNPAEAKVREHLERIDRQVAMVDNVVTALTDVARLPEPTATDCDIRSMLTDSLRGVSLSSLISVEMELSDELPLIPVDPNQLPIVFRNLIRNARDAMPNGGTLTFSASEADGEVTIQISDTGVGIHPEDLLKITEPFFTTKAHGMGLGLAITKAIVENNGGRLEVTSELGRGTCFSIILRAAAPDEKPGSII